MYPFYLQIYNTGYTCDTGHKFVYVIHISIQIEYRAFCRDIEIFVSKNYEKDSTGSSLSDYAMDNRKR